MDYRESKLVAREATKQMLPSEAWSIELELVDQGRHRNERQMQRRNQFRNTKFKASQGKVRQTSGESLRFEVKIDTLEFWGDW